MKVNEKRTEKRERNNKEKRMERLADRLVEAANFNAWEYGNTGNFIF